jgi:hypothetical protein
MTVKFTIQAGYYPCGGKNQARNSNRMNWDESREAAAQTVEELNPTLRITNYDAVVREIYNLKQSISAHPLTYATINTGHQCECRETVLAPLREMERLKLEISRMSSPGLLLGHYGIRVQERNLTEQDVALFKWISYAFNGGAGGNGIHAATEMRYEDGYLKFPLSNFDSSIPIFSLYMLMWREMPAVLYNFSEALGVKELPLMESKDWYNQKFSKSSIQSALEKTLVTTHFPGLGHNDKMLFSFFMWYVRAHSNLPSSNPLEQYGGYYANGILTYIRRILIPQNLPEFMNFVDGKRVYLKELGYRVSGMLAETVGLNRTMCDAIQKEYDRLDDVAAKKALKLKEAKENEAKGEENARQETTEMWTRV